MRRARCAYLDPGPGNIAVDVAQLDEANKRNWQRRSPRERLEQAKLNACRQALNLAPAKPGKEGRAVAYAAHSNLMIQLAAKVGANPFGDNVKTVKEQSGKKTITINTTAAGGNASLMSMEED